MDVQGKKMKMGDKRGGKMKMKMKMLVVFFLVSGGGGCSRGWVLFQVFFFS